MLDMRGLEGLPLKLLIISLILSLSLPTVLGSIETYQLKSDSTQLISEARAIKSAAKNVYSAGLGNTRTIEIKTPPSCMLVIGGAMESIDSLSVRCIRQGKTVAVEWIDDPPFHLVTLNGENLILDENSELVLRCELIRGAIAVSAEALE